MAGEIPNKASYPDSSVEFRVVQDRALEVSNRYDELNQAQLGLVWNDQQIMLGFSSDVGTLAETAMAKNGLRSLAHKLSDCLWSVLVLADKFGVPLVEAFMKTMNELDERIESELE